ncbi:MAG TPA: site-specific DNA-methyltransferase [Candidatus Cloacimonetes bacterium]|nr:site-specific DNA-methyltransferase [Candidatus Cloacimonadota bacterium]
MESAKVDLISLKDASLWASNHLGRSVSISNISYLVQYGRIEKHDDAGNVLVSKEELEKYYKSHNSSRKERWKKILGDDLNWDLSFEQYTEAQTTKHVHRLHPYKGKFIPQLVEYFLDQHTDSFKQEIFFKPGDIVLDPFLGSGTTLIQANELGINAIGVDVSAFNVMISGSKISKYDILDIERETKRITKALRLFLTDSKTLELDRRILDELGAFNAKHFPSPDYRYKVRNGVIDEKSYVPEKEKEFLKTYHALVDEYGVKLLQDSDDTFLDKWFLTPVREEIDFVYKEIQKVENPKTRKILAIVLSRTVRSCRATTHADLATLKDPVSESYYCAKHGKICKPLLSILRWWNTYSKDTIKRITQFDKLRTDTYQICLTDDSRNVDIIKRVSDIMPDFAEMIESKGIKGIFTSPPYVGLIDYHEQHAYAYDLFGFARNDDLEIGPLFRGQGREAQESYTKGVAAVLNNSKRFLSDDYDVFLVANDKHNLYPKIAELAGMQIVNQYKRPVLNRTEKDKGAYAETIFHLKDKEQ